MEVQKVIHPHDSLFHKAMENPIVAREFLEAHLPQDIRKLVDMDSLKLEKNSFIEKDLKKYVCDVLFSAKIANQDGYLYLLLEQQTKPDYWMSMRLMKYMLSICSKYLNTHKKAKKLPLIYPLVLYNGKRKYNVSRNFWNLFNDSKLAKDVWTNDHKIINVHDIPDAELKKRAWSGIMEFFLKHIHERNLINAWEEIQDLIPELIKVERVGLDYLSVILYYTLTAVEKNDKIKIENILKSNLKDKGEEFIPRSPKNLFIYGEDER